MSEAKKKIGLIAMGSRENRPFWQDLIDVLEPECEVEMRGVLDGLTEEEIKVQYAYEPGDNYIVTKMIWGSTVHIKELKARKRVLELADEFFNEGASTVLVLCTGDFDHPKNPKGLFLLPEDLMKGILTGLKQEKLGFIVPEPDQIHESEAQYKELNPIVKAASPYGSMEDLEKTAAGFKDEDVNVVVTDCMGFTPQMGQIVAKASGKQVLVPRLILPKLIKALILQQ